jgi:hypothetical protein
MAGEVPHDPAPLIPRRWMIAGIALGLVLLVAYVVAFLIDEPLRRYTEVKMNRALKGYTVHITKLNFHPLGIRSISWTPSSSRTRIRIRRSRAYRS